MSSVRTKLKSIGILAAGLAMGCLTTYTGAQKHPLAAPVTKIEFNRDIRPILSENCFSCHGPNKSARQAGLRLDERESAVQLRVLAPGHPEKSSLIERINAVGPLMPPATTHKTLTAAQKSLLTQWIAQGAAYQLFWAYAPIIRPAVPKIASTSRYTVRGAIDAFILQKLNEKHITPSREADRRTLIRRLSLDIIGLPPTPAEVSTFLADNSPAAYDKLVDRLLKSPHYGERMALPWLDNVRYADTVGFHGDQNMNAWPYRDYVIDSFNNNKPFDKFTIEQVAGDLLPNPTPEQLTATCFNRLNMVTREGGAQAKEYLAKSQADRVRTVSMTWLGSTFACAECHDHKYDPISTRDFYSLGCFFADMKQWGIYADYGYTPNPDLRGYNNDYPFPPEIKVKSRYLTDRIKLLRSKIGGLAEKAAKEAAANPDAKRDLDAWMQTSQVFLTAHRDGWELPKPEIRTAARNAKGALAPEIAAPACSVLDDNSVALKDGTPGDLTLSLHSQSPYLAALKLELLPVPGNGGKVYRAGKEAADVTLNLSVMHADGTKQAVAFRYAGANLWEPQYNNGYDLIGVQRGWRPLKEKCTELHVSTWLPTKPVKLMPTDIITATFPRLDVGRIRVSISPFVPEHAGAPNLPVQLALDLQLTRGGRLKDMAVVAAAPAIRTALTQYLEGAAWDAAAFDKAKLIEADIFGCREGITPVMVTETIPNPMVMRILARGNWQDESGPTVDPAVPHFLPANSVAKDRRLTRLDLAKWLVSAENPLTARTYVNRLWKLYFGNAISGQVEDLGAQGEWPTHPELLDWLAAEFRTSGWDIKHMVRLIVTSSTYRQESKIRQELHEIDPGNRLLASQNPRRLEAELVRDNALRIAGVLTEDLGGPPCFPYQPEGYYANIQFPDRNYIADRDDRQYRRGVYMHWQRTFLHPMLANFDAPSREDCTASRPNANTPQQALTLLNDPEFVEAARLTAESLLSAKTSTDASRLEALFHKALSRSPRQNEAKSLIEFLGSVRTAYKERPEDAAKLLSIGAAPPPAPDSDRIELAAWTSVCRVVLNLHETITRY